MLRQEDPEFETTVDYIVMHLEKCIVWFKFLRLCSLNLNFVFMSMGVLPPFISVHRMHAVLEEARRGHYISCNWH